MPEQIPTPYEARAALAEAERQAGRLRRTDNRFRLVLLIIAGTYVSLGLLIGIPRLERPAIPPLISLPLVLGGALIWCLVLLLPMRARSRWGYGWFMWSIAAFSIWNGMVVAVSMAAGWWAPGQPGYHFSVSAAVAAVPLVAAAWLIGWRRR
jgi:hypothetical protein